MLLPSGRAGRRATRLTSSAAPRLSEVEETAVELITESSVQFRLRAAPAGPSLFYRPASRLIRDLGVLALAVLGVPGPRVLDAMSGSGVRTLRYVLEGGASFVLANELMEGEHPLEANLAPLVADGRCNVSHSDAIDLYLRGKLDGTRFDMVDVDAFGTGQPHLSEAWYALKAGGLLYICATDSLTTKGENRHKAWSGYAATAQSFPACNEQGLRLVVATAFREAAARNLHAAPVFSYFHRPSSTFRVMMRLVRARRPPAAAFEQLGYVARCPECGELWRVKADELGAVGAMGARRCCAHASRGAPKVSGPLWVGPMHDAAYVAAMSAEAEARGWD